MFNTTTNMNLRSNSQIIQFNAPSTGILQRSNPKSIFLRFQKNSDMESMVFPSNGKTPYMYEFNFNDVRKSEYKDSNYRIEIIVLQILIFGQDNYLVEVIEPKYLIEEKP